VHYKDGTLSPDEVVARINAIRRQNNCPSYSVTEGLPCPSPKPPQVVFGSVPPGQKCLGAQTTVRWYADAVENNNKDDRTLRTVFTHDYFGPSTHQQARRYAGLDAFRSPHITLE
jgi:manganese oxidase